MESIGTPEVEYEYDDEEPPKEEEYEYDDEIEVILPKTVPRQPAKM